MDKLIDKLSRNILNGELNEELKLVKRNGKNFDYLIQDLLFWVANNENKVLHSISNGYMKYLLFRVYNTMINGKYNSYDRQWGLTRDKDIFLGTKTEDEFEINQVAYVKDDLTDKNKIEELFIIKKQVVQNFYEDKIFDLYHQDGLTYRKISELLELPLSTVYKNVKEITRLIKFQIIINDSKIEIEEDEINELNKIVNKQKNTKEDKLIMVDVIKKYLDPEFTVTCVQCSGFKFIKRIIKNLIKK